MAATTRIRLALLLASVALLSACTNDLTAPAVAPQPCKIIGVSTYTNYLRGGVLDTLAMAYIETPGCIPPKWATDTTHR